MSIKGASQELFVGKKDSKIIDLFGNSTKIFYSDLKKIEYCYFQIGVGGGYLDFVYDSNNVKRFDFNHKANDKIRRTIELIQENNPELEIIEHSTEDYKFYQKDWFYILMLFICCMPLGLFLMWYYKKGTKSMRIILTVLFITLWGIGIFSSWPRTYSYHITLNEYNQCTTGMTYQECVNIIGGEGEPMAETNILDINSTAYIWYGDDSSGANATMYFTNGKLTSKAQFGLK